MSLRAIFFDLDDTLVDSTRVHARGLDAARRALSRERSLAPTEFRRRYARARALVKKRLGPAPAARSRLLYFKAMIEDWLSRQDPALALAASSAYERAWSARAGASVRRLLSGLARRYTLGVLTNQMCALQLTKLKAIDPRGRLIRILVTSEELGVEKPDRRFFAEACRRAGCRPAEALMVGDNREHDVEGGLRAGLRVALLSPAGRAPKGVARLRRLSDLPRLLAELGEPS
ncbi:MAG: HAD family hydrolase [Elusimicrobiota bacterium]